VLRGERRVAGDVPADKLRGERSREVALMIEVLPCGHTRSGGGQAATLARSAPVDATPVRSPSPEGLLPCAQARGGGGALPCGRAHGGGELAGGALVGGNEGGAGGCARRRCQGHDTSRGGTTIRTMQGRNDQMGVGVLDQQG
jgi:hypothetical protein